MEKSTQHFIPKEWEDDMRMTVMFSPFRDKNLNPKSWEQKIKFWSELIIEDCKLSKTSIIDTAMLKERFRRKGKSPSCLNTVIEEMVSKGMLKKLSDVQQSDKDGWLSWGYDKLVKRPIGWSMKWLSGQPEEIKDDRLVVMDVIKEKAKEIMTTQNRLSQQDSTTTNIIEYDKLQLSYNELCPTDIEFSLVMRELVDNRQAVIQVAADKTKLVKFILKENTKKVETINERDIHIHRIQKAQGETMKQIDLLTTEVDRLGSEAVAYKQKGMTKLAMSNMRKRKLAMNRIDKLTGSIETLEELLHQIKQAESNEMIVKAIEGGTSILRDITGKTTVDDISNVMDNLADVTQSQEDMMAELSTSYMVDEPSQSELEDELSDILKHNTPPRKYTTGIHDDADIEQELNDILNESDSKSSTAEGITDMFNVLHLPDVPGHSPEKTKKTGQLLSS